GHPRRNTPVPYRKIRNWIGLGVAMPIADIRTRSDCLELGAGSQRPPERHDSTRLTQDALCSQTQSHDRCRLSRPVYSPRSFVRSLLPHWMNPRYRGLPPVRTSLYRSSWVQVWIGVDTRWSMPTRHKAQAPIPTNMSLPSGLRKRGSADHVTCTNP